MKSRNFAVAAGGLLCSAGLVVGVSGVAHADTNPTSTAAKSAPGNNGTLKIHELGAPPHTPSNQPHVCKFNLEYFYQDSLQPGYNVTIEPQGGNGGPSHLNFTMPAADESGYSESVYINADPVPETDGYTLKNGHYKVTVMGKDGKQAGNDTKAKSKVIWVKCEPGPTTPPPTSTSTTTPPPTSTSTTTPPPTSTTTPPPTSTSTTTPPPTSTTTTSTSTPPPASTSTLPPSSTGPVVVTDGPSGGSSSTGSELLGGGLGAAGLALLGYGLLRRRLSE